MSEQKKDENLTDELSAVLEEFVAEEVVEERIVFPVDDTHILIGEVSYEIIEDYREGFEIDALNHRYNDILNRYDYIVGDWGHEKLRLKGFFKANHRLATPERDITYLQEYLNEYCNFGCRYFVLERDPNAKVVVVEEEIPKRPKTQKNNRRSQRRQANPKNEAKTTDKTNKTSNPKNNYRNNKKTNQNENSRPKSAADFGLKEMIQKENLHVEPKTSNVIKEPRKKRSFSMKEVEQPRNQKNSKAKVAKNRSQKRFDMREKPQKRGQ